MPYDRDTRTVIYEQAKGIHTEQAFGTERDVNQPGYEFLLHATVPKQVPDETPHVRVRGPDCTKPYEMALLNAPGELLTDPPRDWALDWRFADADTFLAVRV